MTSPLDAAKAVWQTFGLEGARRRAGFELRKRMSRLLSDPPAVPGSVLAHAPPERWPFNANRERLRRDASTVEALARADRVLAGEYEAYRAAWRRRPMTCEEWNSDFESGHTCDPTAPWFRVPHTAFGVDIKDAWEPGRFAWAYDLARAWMLTGNDRYAEGFWSGFESFRTGCPPYRGVQWACGQETAVRAIALLWCETALSIAPSTTPARQASLRETLYWSGRRIADALDYALSQRNNHGISECVGLLAVGARFRAVDSDAERWWREGRPILEQQILDQFALDGWYAQHSFTYLRLALDQLVLAQRLLGAHGESLSEPAAERVRKAVRLLGTVMNGATGDVPNHGANDGAFVLPLTTRPYRDFRPSLTAAAATFHVPLPQGIEPDAEVLAWLDRESPGTDERVRPAIIVGESGWLDARVGRSRIFARAGSYRSRPSHIDALHLDIWIDGRPVAADAGTFRYPGEWSRALAEERAHNTVSIPRWPMAERGPRFLWLRWPRAAIASFRETGGAITVEMHNESWKTLGIHHRRTCRLADGAVTVLDEVALAPGKAARVSIHWLIDGLDGDVGLLASVPSDAELHRGETDSPYGWIADSYAVRRPATSVRLTTREAVTRVRFVSGFGAARENGFLQGILAHGIGASPDSSSLLSGAVH